MQNCCIDRFYNVAVPSKLRGMDIYMIIVFRFLFRSADHTKWVGAFHRKQDFIDVVEVRCY